MKTPDTFLEAHRVGPLQFMVSGSLTPISIRDQIVRAKMFVDRAKDAGLIAPDRALFIIGAGVAGVTAAIWAAQNKIPVTVIERREKEFALQRTCLSRWINPTQYDWPARHWNKGRFPWTLASVPLPCESNRANLLACAWVEEFRKARRKYQDLLKCYFSTQIQDRICRNEENLEVTFVSDFQSAPKVVVDQFGAALYAIGHGTELTTLGVYKSFDFWETDDFELPVLGLPAMPAPYRYGVLICGGGDGALQDFLRITTGKPSATDILNDLLPDISCELLAQIYSAEDQAQRTMLWGDRSHDHPVLLRLDAIHRVLVRQLLASRDGWRIVERLDALLQPSQVLDITLVHPCSHFSQAYPLNRFLVYLIAEYAQSAGLPIQILPRTGATNVQGVLHICEGDPGKCHGQDHYVTLRAIRSCAKLEFEGDDDVRRFQIVVLRVGRKAPPPPLGDIAKPLFLRQLLPYHTY